MHKNNFDFLRLCFALFVLITHSYVLAGSDNDFLSRFTGGQVNFSAIGLKGFFIISGFLIFESLLRSRNWIDYMIKRVLRIYPALIVVLIFCFFLGLALSPEPAGQYLRDKDALSYVYGNLNLFAPLKYKIHNVFPQNPLPDAINGSLWTIPYEFLFYVLLSAFFIIRSHTKLITVLLVLLFGSLFLLKIKYSHQEGDLWMLPWPYEKKNLLNFALLFASGSLLASIRLHQYKYKKAILVGSLMLCLVMITIKQFEYTQYFLLPLLIITLGSLSTSYISGLNKSVGDFSYGIYLYGFPVQQTLIHFFKLSPLGVLAVAMPITILLAALSWFLIEKRALGIKQYLKEKRGVRIAEKLV